MVVTIGSEHGVELLYSEKPWLENIVPKGRIAQVRVERFDEDFLKQESRGLGHTQGWGRIIFLTEPGEYLGEVGYRGKSPLMMDVLGLCFFSWMHFKEDVGLALHRMCHIDRMRVHYAVVVEHGVYVTSLELRKPPKECSVAELVERVRDRFVQEITT